MNPFEKINELKEALQQEIQSSGVKPQDTIPCIDHYQRMFNLLALVEHELKDAEYNYVLSSLDGSTIKTFDKVTIKQEELAPGLLLFSPLTVDDDELNSIDMNSLYEVLCKLKDDGTIKEDILVVPPYINTVRAKLAIPEEEIGSPFDEDSPSDTTYKKTPDDIMQDAYDDDSDVEDEDDGIEPYYENDIDCK